MYENDYPFLFQWKAKGLDKFPSIPKELIVDILHDELKIFISAYNKKRKPKKEPEKEPNSDYILVDIQNSLFAALSYRFSEQKLSRVSQLKDAAKKHLRYYAIGVVGKWTEHYPDDPLRRDLYLYVEYQLSQLKIKRNIAWGQRVAEAREQIRHGKSRPNVMRELGKYVLPGKRPGSASFSDNDLEALWPVYLEMQACIKDFRKELDFPLKVLPQHRVDEVESVLHLGDSPYVFAKERIPKIDEIFEEGEIKKILSNKKTSDIAVDVIFSRLANCKSQKIKIGSPRTLQNILHQSNQKFSR
jgi:hypothetical protein